MSKHHTTHKSAEARELAAERRANERERMQARKFERAAKVYSRVAFGGAR